MDLGNEQPTILLWLDKVRKFEVITPLLNYCSDGAKKTIQSPQYSRENYPVQDTTEDSSKFYTVYQVLLCRQPLNMMKSYYRKAILVQNADRSMNCHFMLMNINFASAV